MLDPIDPNIPKGLSKLLSQGDSFLTANQTERAVLMYCNAYAWDSCVTETHLNSLSHQCFQALISVLEDYCVWWSDTGRRFPVNETTLTLEQLCDWLTKSNMKPNSYVAWATKVNIQMQKGKYDNVVDSCCRVIKLGFSQNLTFLLTRGTAHLYLRHTDDAIHDYVTAYELNHRVTGDYIRETHAQNVDKLTEACREFVVKLKETEGNCDKSVQDEDKKLLLIKCYKFLVMLRPGDMKTYLECADIMMKLQKHKDAVILLSEGMEFTNDDNDVLCIALQRAEVYLVTGELELALNDYLTALRIDNELTHASMMLVSQQNKAKIAKQASVDADSLLEYYSNQNKSCRSSFFINDTQGTGKQLSRAYDCYCIVTLFDPTNIDMLLNSAECLVLQRKETKALEIYAKAATLNPQCAKVYNARGSCYLAMGYLANALSDFECAVSIDALNSRAVCKKIITLVLLGQLQNSVSFLSGAVNTHLLHVIVNNLKEFPFDQMESVRIRLTTFLKSAIENDDVCNDDKLCLLGQVLTRVFPNDLPSHVAYAELLMSRDQGDESQSILVRFVNNNPSSYQGPVWLALLKIRLGKTVIGIKELRFVLKNIGEDGLNVVFSDIERKDRELIYKEAYTQGMRQTTAVAEKIELFTLAIIVNSPKSWFSYFHRGKQLFGSRQFDLAFRDFSNAININPNHVPSYVMRSIVFIRNHRFDEALHDFLKAIQFDSKLLIRLVKRLPDSYRRIILRVVYDYLQKQFSLFNTSGVKSVLILTLSTILVDIDGTLPLYHSTLADACFVFENYQQALKELEITQKLSTNIDTFIIGQLGLAHVKLNHYATAVQSFCRMYELDLYGLEYFLTTLNANQLHELTQQALNQANDLTSDGNHHDALVLLNFAVVTTKGQRRDILRSRCTCLIALQSYQRALGDVTGVIGMGHALISDYCTRASICSQLGDFPGACADLIKAIDMDEQITMETLKNTYPDLEVSSIIAEGIRGYTDSKLYKEALKACMYGLRVDPGNEELAQLQERLPHEAKHGCVIQ